jgi:hypothetical protein
MNPRRLQVSNLSAVSEWLDSTNPPGQEEARILFNTLIPALIDLEVAGVFERARGLLETTHGFAKLPASALARKLAEIDREQISSCHDTANGKDPTPTPTCGVTISLGPLPSSCGSCAHSVVSDDYGMYALRCHHDGQLRTMPIATVRRELFPNGKLAFEEAHRLLYEKVRDTPSPDWCPLRVS